MEIDALTNEKEWREAFPVMQELRPDLTIEDFVESLSAILPAGYKLFAIRVKGKIACLAGFQIHTNIPYGRHIWVYDLVTGSKHRSNGYGKVMLSFIEAFAKHHGCSTVALQTSLVRDGAQNFYETHAGFERFGFVFHKKLGGEVAVEAPLS